ncbi:MAG: hypothetical protein IT443_13530 [Phycisphaeraceae bacterium]|nr:hypothetical protein [Phycisphaeraceae bacterium]
MSRKTKQSDPLFEAWDVLLQYRWRFMVAACLVAAGVMLGSLFLPRKFEGRAIFESRTDTVMNQIVTRGATPSFKSTQQSTYNQVIGETALDKLIEQLRQSPKLMAELNVQPNEIGGLRGDLARKLSLHFLIANSDLDQIQLSYVSTNPLFARWAINTLVDNYMSRAKQQLEQSIGQSAGFFRKEVETTRAAIEELENKKLAYEIEHAELLPDNPNNLQASLLELRAELTSLEFKRDNATLTLQSLGKAVSDTPEISPKMIKQRNPQLDQLQQELNAAQAQLQTCLTTMRMTDQHPDVVDLRAKVDSLKQRLAQTDPEVVTQREFAANPKRNELDVMIATASAELDGYQKRLNTVQQQIRNIEQQTDRMYPVRAEYLKLTRNISELQSQQSFWEDNLRRVEMVMTADSDDRSVQMHLLKPCGPLSRPISPRLAQVLLAALALGMLGGAAAVFLAQRSDETFRRGSQVTEAFDMPVLGSVSELISIQQQRLRRFRHLVLGPVNVAALAAMLIFAVSLTYLHLEKPEVIQKFTAQSGSLLGLFAGDESTPVAQAQDPE